MTARRSRQTAFVALCLFATVGGFYLSQDRPEPPTPCPIVEIERTLENSYLFEYDERVLAALWPEDGPSSIGHSRAVFLATPSFQEEWALALGRETARGVELELRTAQLQVWYANHVDGVDEQGRPTRAWSSEPVDVDVRVRTTLISESLARAMERLTTHGAQIDSPPSRIGLDGATYRFYAPDGSCKAWWSPQPSHPVAPLRSWLEDLRSSAFAGDETGEDEIFSVADERRLLQRFDEISAMNLETDALR